MSGSENFLISIQEPIFGNYHWLNGALTLESNVEGALLEGQQSLLGVAGSLGEE